VRHFCFVPLAVAPLMRQFYGLVFIEIISWGFTSKTRYCCTICFKKEKLSY